MISSRIRTKRLWLGLLIIIIIALVLLFGSQSQPDKTGTQGQPSVTTSVNTDNFEYPKPPNWLKLSKEFLDSNSANSGIGYLNQPVTFMVQVSDSVPSSETELKNSTLKAIQGFESFELIASEATKINDKSGQKFVFRFGGQEKSKKELSVVVHNNKTYFLLHAAPEADFDKYQADFSSIVSGFKFK